MGTFTHEYLKFGHRNFTPGEYNHLVEMLQTWIEWAHQPSPDDRYNRDEGLCNAIFRYTDDDTLADRLWELLKEEFARDGLSITYPFGSVEFQADQKQHQMHLCEVRRTWVKCKIIQRS